MLSIRDELLKLVPADVNGGSPAIGDAPPDLLGQWQQIAAGITDIAAGQRRSVEQLESFLQAVRSAAADTQRTAAVSRTTLEEQRTLAEKERTEFLAALERHAAELLERHQEAERRNTNAFEQAKAATEAMRSLVAQFDKEMAARAKEVDTHLAARDRDLNAVVEPLASATLGFRELASRLDTRLGGLEALGASLRSNADAVRDAVREELVHRHAEFEQLQAAGQKSADATLKRVATEVESMRQSLTELAERANAAERERARLDTEMRARAESETAIRAKAEVDARALAASEAKGRAEAEERARKMAEEKAGAEANSESVSEQLRATSTSMMAFLEALDDLASLPIAQDGTAGKTLTRLSSRAQRVIEAAGLIEISAEGTEANEELHEVVKEIPASAEVPAGRVVTVVQRGFRNADRVVRRAQVIVAR